ncbi:MAG: hypothetical protein COT85_00245 [Chlamydiae bacterium CG10_big_fil_rev_8_21_14_0_10_42_34]|nr:MAG: hypothetical protein COT85_00245 [Chlamydiae bacterium CG10_big_fil_rev_8_21_14_0_10_42_34]
MTKVISFYTKGTIYEKEIEDLALSCKALQIDHYIEEREDLGAWEKNCNQKPLFILECLEKFNCPLLWVDSDGILLKKPNLNLQEVDLGLYFNNAKTKHARNATIYVSPTNNTKKFLRLWYETLQKMNSRPRKNLIPDQPVMISLIRKGEIPLKIGNLPLEYMQIFDRDQVPLEKTVILHFQASRTARMDPIFWQHLTGKELKAIRMANSKSVTS